MLTAVQMETNWNIHLEIIKRFLSGNRQEKVLKMITHFQDDMVIAPASIKAHYHNAFPGGYIDHVNRVVKTSLEVSKLWKKMGCMIDFSEEELVFSALFHDLGKMGDGKHQSYITQTDKWRREKLGEIYTINPEVGFMLIQDRSLYILQSFGIQMTEVEYLAIKTHDGLYDDTNKPYLISFNPDAKMRTNLPYILSQADYIAYKVEYDSWNQNKGN